MVGCSYSDLFGICLLRIAHVRALPVGVQIYWIRILKLSVFLVDSGMLRAVLLNM